MSDAPYNRKFFELRQSGVLLSAESVSQWIWNLLSPQSVLDVGCGTGDWLAAFRRRGVTDLLGIDGDWVPRDRLEIPSEQFRTADLRRALVWNRRFDLAICLEVAEHLPTEHAPQLVQALTDASPVVLFSAAVPHQGGTGHVNEQWPEYWINLFSERGHVCVDCLRGRFWNDEKVAWWYVQNAFFFVAESAAGPLARLRAEAQEFPLSECNVVHPALFEARIRELSSPMSYSLRRMLTAFPTLLVRTLRARLGGGSP